MTLTETLLHLLHILRGKQQQMTNKATEDQNVFQVSAKHRLVRTAEMIFLFLKQCTLEHYRFMGKGKRKRREFQQEFQIVDNFKHKILFSMATFFFETVLYFQISLILPSN